MTNSHSDSSINTRDYAERLDQQDPLKHLRDEFIIPTKADLKRKTLTRSGNLLPPPTAKVLTDVCGSLYD
jgi:kynureninase